MNIFEERKEPKIFEVGIDETAKVYMLETARWTKFLAVLAFIGMGLLLVVGLFSIFGLLMAGNQVSAEVPGFRSGYTFGAVLAYILFSLLYMYPAIELFRFSKEIKTAIVTADVVMFNSAMRHQRNMFRFIGILMIVLLAFYGIALCFLLLAGMTSL